VIGDSLTRAVLVARESSRAVRLVLEQCVNDPSVMAIQREVLAGQRSPEY
jgi:hypothetical protein